MESASTLTGKACMRGIIPIIKYRNARAAIEWLNRAFGFTVRLLVPGPGDSVVHAQLERGAAFIMLNSVRDDGVAFSPHDPSGSRCIIYVVEANVGAVFAAAVAAGATALQPPTIDEHGARSFQVQDPKGHAWSFCTYDPLAVT
jgi:uncharacterized glyoxalase superfamily protein PhnB